MDRFVSNTTLRLDSKGRVSIPASFRSVLGRDGFDGLYCYPALDSSAIDAGGNALMSEIEALERDRNRLGDERTAAEAELAVARRALTAPVPPRDLDLDAALGEAERELADALAELAELRGANQAHGQELAALRRAGAARRAEVDTAQRRLADVERRVAEARDQSESSAGRRRELEEALDAARSATTSEPRSPASEATEAEPTT